MGLNSKLLPDNIRRRMSIETRKAMGTPTDQESKEKHDEATEKELQDQISSLLRLRGIWFERKAMHKKSTGTPGCPDFLFAINNKPIAFEVKVGENNLSPDQFDCFGQMNRNGWHCYIVRDLAVAKTILDSFL